MKKVSKPKPDEFNEKISQELVTLYDAEKANKTNGFPFNLTPQHCIVSADKNRFTHARKLPENSAGTKSSEDSENKSQLPDYE